MAHKLPEAVIEIISRLEKVGYEAYIVGGAVRDVLLGRDPKDWDIATSAQPGEIQSFFPDSLYENQFGTVTVRIDDPVNSAVSQSGTRPRLAKAVAAPAAARRELAGSSVPKFDIKEVQVTTFRVEEEYSNQRHPDRVKFVGSLKEDLARRDFTINAIAIKTRKHENTKTQKLQLENTEIEIIDPFGGQNDLAGRLIRAVGNPEERFQEDALRLMRAVRFAVQLGFQIEPETYGAVKSNAHLLKKISAERIRDEFIKILETPQAAHGIRLLVETGLLQTFLPELTQGIGVAQSKHHIYEVFEHLVRALDYAARNNFSVAVRLAALFHDIGKPQTKRGQGPEATFYNHEIVGARMSRQIMRHLRIANDLVDKVYLLVRYHQFYYTPEEVTPASVRRLLKNVGRENIDELLQVREADRIGSGVPKAVPYKLRHLKYMIEQVQTDPISVKMLAINGDDLVKELGLVPSPKMGLILKSLLAEVLENPQKNQKPALLVRARELMSKSDADLIENLAKIEAAQAEQEEVIKRKYYVK